MTCGRRRVWAGELWGCAKQEQTPLPSSEAFQQKQLPGKAGTPAPGQEPWAGTDLRDTRVRLLGMETSETLNQEQHDLEISLLSSHCLEKLLFPSSGRPPRPQPQRYLKSPGLILLLSHRVGLGQSPEDWRPPHAPGKATEKGSNGPAQASSRGSWGLQAVGGSHRGQLAPSLGSC